MAANLVVISSTENVDLSCFSLVDVINNQVTQGNHGQDFLSYLDNLQVQDWGVKISNHFGFDEVFIATGLPYCESIRLCHNTVFFQPSGFRIRFSSWIKMFNRSHMESTQELQYWDNWRNFQGLVCALTRVFGGEVVIYIDDGSLQLEGRHLDTGNGFNYFFAAMKKQMESWPLEYLELYFEEFEARSSFFYKKISKTNTDDNEPLPVE